MQRLSCRIGKGCPWSVDVSDGYAKVQREEHESEHMAMIRAKRLEAERLTHAETYRRES